MWSNSDPVAQTEPRTFIEQARRAQIVGVAIDTIAEVGYAQASLARIAERAGISKGVIAYHFAGKEDLIREVAAEVLSRAEQFMRPRISARSGGPAVLREYVESNLAFMAAYRNHMVAIVEIARGARRPDGTPGFDRSSLDAGAAGLAQLLANFQAAGELRADFDPQVMAMAIRAAIDAVPPRLAADPSLDVEHHGRELANLFDLATRNDEKPRRKSRR
ncbi:MAG: TetR family transcriptional regulator [Solirubrobacterales bacterium]|nr:TetR family transcriptional regulator [Solirubrobacterales bacterium]